MSASATVKMYTRPGCWFCAAARRLLQQKGVPFEDIDIGGQPELRQEMEKLSGGYTVPQIFINDRPVGGYDDINALDKRGELDPLLSAPREDKG